VRFIDLEQIKPKIRALLADLADAQRQVTAETDPVKREELIKKFRPRWVALRDEFSAYSNGKCWYVECRNLGTDDDIDHYRPKLAVKEDPSHPGYYWLAFDWKNLRLSCHRANRPRINAARRETGGKADHFPLLNPAQRAMSPAANLALEKPALLDPTDPADPPLLSFLPSGEAALSPAFKGIAIAEERFEASRIGLHFNWPAFTDARVVLYNRVERTVERGQREAPTDYSGVPAASSGFKDAIRDLVSLVHPREEYSVAAKIYVESFKDIWWVRDIVLKVAS
jgi:hypothetical protein